MFDELPQELIHTSPRSLAVHGWKLLLNEEVRRFIGRVNLSANRIAVYRLSNSSDQSLSCSRSTKSSSFANFGGSILILIKGANKN